MPSNTEIYDKSHAALLEQLKNALLATAGTGLAVGAGVSGLNWLQNSGISAGEPRISTLPVPLPRGRVPGSLPVDRMGKLLSRIQDPEEDEHSEPVKRLSKLAAMAAVQPVTAKPPVAAAVNTPQPRMPRLVNTAGPMNNPLAAVITRRPPAPLVPPAPMGMKQADSAAANTGSAAGSAIWNAITGRYARSMMGMPLALPALAAAGGLSVLAGDKLMDISAGAMNKSRRKAETDEAEEAYRAALLSQYANGKQASQQNDTAVKLGRALDTVYEFLDRTLPSKKISHEKTATVWSRLVGDVPGMMAGGVLGVGALSGLSAAVAAYQLGKKHSGRALLEEAVKERKRQLASSGVNTTFAVTQPVEEDEEMKALSRI